MKRHSLYRNLTSSGRQRKSRLRLRQPFLFAMIKLFMKRHWHNVAIVRLIFAIAIKCRTKFVIEVPVWLPVRVSIAGLWTCRCVDLSPCRPVGVSTCRRVDFRRVDLSSCRPVGNRPVGNKPVSLLFGNFVWMVKYHRFTHRGIVRSKTYLENCYM